jgi:hypothetical protein
MWVRAGTDSRTEFWELSQSEIGRNRTELELIPEIGGNCFRGRKQFRNAEHRGIGCILVTPVTVRGMGRGVNFTPIYFETPFSWCFRKALLKRSLLRFL